MIKKLAITIFLIIMFILPTITVNAAIEIKPGTDVHTNITVSDSYKYCYDLRNKNSTLGTNSLDPHLTTNADWGAVAYLGLSSYGYGGQNADGREVYIGGMNWANRYYSTSMNITGVINFGHNYTQTASLIEGYATSAARKNLEDNSNTKYVEILSQSPETETKKGLALNETRDMLSSSFYDWYGNTSCPVSVRYKMTGYWFKNNGSQFLGNGEKNNETTFRPVIWN